jgi:hypothetical protein
MAIIDTVPAPIVQACQVPGIFPQAVDYQDLPKKVADKPEIILVAIVTHDWVQGLPLTDIVGFEFRKIFFLQDGVL